MSKLNKSHFRAITIFVCWVFRRLKEKGLIEVGLESTDAGEAEYWETIENLRKTCTESVFVEFIVFHLESINAEVDMDFCRSVAKMARNLKLIADKD